MLAPKRMQAARRLPGDHGCCVGPNCWYNKKKEAKGLPNRMMLLERAVFPAYLEFAK
jgi:hypothetical protein